jgi:hypothetical protein
MPQILSMQLSDKSANQTQGIDANILATRDKNLA